MVRSLFVFLIALTMSAAVAAVPAEAKKLKSTSHSGTVKQKAQSKAAAAGVDTTTAKANAKSKAQSKAKAAGVDPQNITQAQKDQAWATVQSKVFARLNSALQKARAECKGNAQCQSKVADAMKQAGAQIKKEAQDTVQWCKSTKCATEAINAKVEEIYYRKCAQFFNNCPAL